MSSLYEELKQQQILSAVCQFCIGAFDEDRALVENELLPLVGEYNGHPSMAKLTADGYQVITI